MRAGEEARSGCVELAVSAEAQTSSGLKFQPRSSTRGLTVVQALRLVQSDDNPLINVMILILGG